MTLSTHPSGPNYVALVEAVLALLSEGGIGGRAAAWGLDILLLYPTAVAVEHGGPRSSVPEDVELSDLAAKIAVADPVLFPNIALLGAELVSGDGGSRSDFAFDVLLDGILAASSREKESQ
jgi:hypothetical protein